MIAVGFVLSIFGGGRLFIWALSLKDDWQHGRQREAACAHLRKLASHPLEMCEADLKSDEALLGGLYSTRLHCLSELTSLNDYPLCREIQHLTQLKKQHRPRD